MMPHLRRFVGAYLCAAVLFWLSDRPRLPLPMPTDWFDKVYHAAGYAVFAGLIWRGLRGSPGAFFRSHAAALACALAAAYGVADEWHQSFVPGRAADPRDMAADAAGAFLFCAGAAVGSRRAARPAAALPGHETSGG